MSSTVKGLNALIVFCEGAHDIAFLNKILRGMGFGEEKRKLSAYPSPFGRLFEGSVQRFPSGDFTLHMEDKFFLPDKVYSKNNEMVFIFSTGGKDKFQKVKEFLDDLSLFIDEGDFSYDVSNTNTVNQVVENFKYLFVYDADNLGLEAVSQELAGNIATVDGWEKVEWSSCDDHSFAMVDKDKALYVLAATPDQGTLEDILYPLSQEKNPEKLLAAEEAVNNLFSWEAIEDKCPIALESKRKKSIITLIGQRDNSGESMARVLNNRNLYVDNFQDHELVIPIKKFLAHFLTS